MSLSNLPSEIILHHLLPFTYGLAQDLIPLYNSSSLLRSKFKEFSLNFSCDGRKCFQNSKFVKDLSVVASDWSLELNDGFVAILESEIYQQVYLDFRWTKLSEIMVKLLTREEKCLELIAHMHVYETIGSVESILLNANWKQLSVLKFSSNLRNYSKVKKQQIVDVSRIAKLEIFEMNDNIRLEMPKKSNNIHCNLKELKLSGHESLFFAKLFRKCNLECLEIRKCDLREVELSAVKSSKLKSLNLSKSKLNNQQFIELFQNGNLINLESLRITLKDLPILKQLFESSIFNKTLSALVIEKEFEHSFWNGDTIWKLFLNGTLKNLKHLNISKLVMHATNIQSLIKSNILLESLTINEIIGYEPGDFKQCFTNLTHLQIGKIDASFPLNEMQQLKHLSFNCNEKIPLNLPNLESIETHFAYYLCFEKNSTNNLKRITCIDAPSFYSIVNSLIENPLNNLESFHFECKWHGEYTKADIDDAMHSIATHSNFSNLKELTIESELHDSCIEHLAHSQLKLNSLIIYSPYLTINSAYEICDGSIEAKMIQLRFLLDDTKDPLFYGGSLNGLIQIDLKEPSHTNRLNSSFSILMQCF